MAGPGEPGASRSGGRKATPEQRLEGARERAREAEAALADEQRRLEKLWTAYKTQEAELEDEQEAKRELRERLHAERERADELAEDLQALEASRERHREEKAQLQAEIDRCEERIEELEPFVAFEAEVERLAAELEDERARLAKLYAVFEESEAEREALAGRTDAEGPPA